MKFAFHVLIIVFAALLLVLSAAFLFIEGRLLVSCDWMLHEIPHLAFLQYLSRLTLAGMTAFLSVRLFQKRR